MQQILINKLHAYLVNNLDIPGALTMRIRAL